VTRQRLQQPFSDSSATFDNVAVIETNPVSTTEGVVMNNIRRVATAAFLAAGSLAFLVLETAGRFTP